MQSGCVAGTVCSQTSSSTACQYSVMFKSGTLKLFTPLVCCVAPALVNVKTCSPVSVGSVFSPSRS